MGLGQGAEVVDFGAGKCEWLARIAAAVSSARCVGVEPAAMFADEARRRHSKQIQSGGLEILQCSAADFLARLGERRFDAALCIGSTHAFGDYERTLTGAAACIKPGGVLVVAEGYWKKKPSPEYLKALGGDESEFTTHAGNVERAIERGLTPLWACTVTDDEWDEYEWGYSRGIESWVREHPNDPDVDAMLARSRSWRESFVKWGRDTLGFGVYVLRVAG